MAKNNNKAIRYSIYAAALVYLVGLVVYLPARLLVAFAPLPEHVQLSGVSGTVWNGRIDRVQFDTRALEQVEWQVFPLALFAAQVVADVQIIATTANPISGTARVQTGFFGGTKIENARLNGELGTLGAWLNIPDLVPLSGDVVLGVTEYELGQPVCSVLNARAGAYDVKTRIGQQWYELGDFGLQLGCQEGLASVLIEPDNSLGLSVNGNFAPGNVDLAVAIKPSNATPAPLRELLRMVGEPDVNGQFNFRFRL